MHDIADILVIGWFACGLATSRPPLGAVGVGLGYAIVFASNFLIEHNTPRTLGQPFLAGVSTWRMVALRGGGRLDRIVRLAGAGSGAEGR